MDDLLTQRQSLSLIFPLFTIKLFSIEVKQCQPNAINIAQLALFFTFLRVYMYINIYIYIADIYSVEKKITLDWLADYPKVERLLHHCDHCDDYMLRIRIAETGCSSNSVSLIFCLLLPSSVVHILLTTHRQIV